MREDNKNCYKAQSYASSRALIEALQLDKNKVTTSFQSRLGRTPWIKPYTDVVLKELADKGVKKLAVFCPSFVADCLETLEENGIRNKEFFIEHGGKEFDLIPCVNADDYWVKALSALIRCRV
jgi:ferrochelatase